MRAVVLLAGIVLCSPALAEDIVICTPEAYYNYEEPSPIIIPIDEARARGSRTTRIDLEFGSYREHLIPDAATTIHSGAMTVVNPGSLRERIDFIAIEAKSGEVIHISLVDDGLPFVRVDAEGTVASGHCVYGNDR